MECLFSWMKREPRQYSYSAVPLLCCAAAARRPPPAARRRRRRRHVRLRSSPKLPETLGACFQLSSWTDTSKELPLCRSCCLRTPEFKIHDEAAAAPPHQAPPRRRRPEPRPAAARGPPANKLSKYKSLLLAGFRW